MHLFLNTSAGWFACFGSLACGQFKSRGFISESLDLIDQLTQYISYHDLYVYFTFDCDSFLM